MKTTEPVVVFLLVAFLSSQHIVNRGYRNKMSCLLIWIIMWKGLRDWISQHRVLQKNVGIFLQTNNCIERSSQHKRPQEFDTYHKWVYPFGWFLEAVEVPLFYQCLLFSTKAFLCCLFILHVMSRRHMKQGVYKVRVWKAKCLFNHYG